jgi:CRISPR-associated protein Cmr1
MFLEIPDTPIFVFVSEIELNRKAPAFPVALKTQTFSPRKSSSAYTIDVITALFGGGVVAGENDPVTLIRVPSIRGHLRFWWRATRGARFGTAAQLAEAEGKIWGTTQEPSRISLVVNVTRPGMVESYETLASRGHLSYVLFPFQGSTREGKVPANGRRGVQFTLQMQFPDELACDVKAAVWAWVNFGGIGARTRRGCGALFCKELAPPSAKEVTAWLATNLAAFGPSDSSVHDWPTLGSVHVHSQSNGPENAWNAAISILHRFRQGDIGRNPGQRGRAGRSRWPEADSLRALTGRAHPDHRESVTLPNPKLHPAFPRARLGLPIVFHFKDEQDPKQVELYPEGKECTRMASPVILKPLALGNGSAALPMVVRLHAQGPKGLRLSDETLGSFSGSQFILRPDLPTYPNSPMARRSKKGSALVAFLALAKEAGFMEVR